MAAGLKRRRPTSDSGMRPATPVNPQVARRGGDIPRRPQRACCLLLCWCANRDRPPPASPHPLRAHDSTPCSWQIVALDADRSIFQKRDIEQFIDRFDIAEAIQHERE
jgi:hypothetical protein